MKVRIAGFSDRLVTAKPFRGNDVWNLSQCAGDRRGVASCRKVDYERTWRGFAEAVESEPFLPLSDEFCCDARCRGSGVHSLL